MPCICYGAVSGNEMFDTILKSKEGQETFEDIKKLANRIKNHEIHEECMDIEYRQTWVKCLLHLLIGCTENGLPVATK